MGNQTIIQVNNDMLPETGNEAEELEWARHLLTGIRQHMDMWGDQLREGDDIAPGLRFTLMNHHTERVVVEFDGRASKRVKG